MPTPAEVETFVRNTKVKDLRALAAEKGRKGYVAQANADGTAGQVRWEQASTTPDDKYNQNVAGETRKTEDRMIAKLHEGLPKVVRRTGQERFRVLFDRLVEQAMVSYRARGFPVWPKSIQDKLLTLGYAPGNPDVYAQCKALAQQLFLEAGAIQRAKDQRKVTLDWRGDYNNIINLTPSAKGRAGQPAQSITTVTG